MKKRMTLYPGLLLLCLSAWLLITAAGAVSTSSQSGVSFSDVSPEDYFAPAVSWAVEKGITNGTSRSTFSPSRICTRGQVVTFLWRSENCPDVNGENPFRDVRADAYYTKAVLWAVQNGITNGVTETSFAPNQTCTHAQILTFLWRAAGTPSVASSTGKISSTYRNYWAFQALAWAEQCHMLDNMESSFQPGADCSRASVVTYLYRYSMFQADHSHAMESMGTDEIFYTASSHEDFAKAVSALTQEYANKVTVSKENSRYASGRLIVKASSLPDISDYGAVRILKDISDFYVIQFTNDRNAEQCADYLQTLPDTVYVEPDQTMVAYSGTSLE